MKVKRSLFILILIMLFAGCYVIMNQHYDDFARYPHELSESQRELILKYLNTDEINTLISQKIEPDEFLPYIEIDGFRLDNTLWYDEAYKTQKENVSKEFIVAFINKYKNRMSYNDLDNLINYYSFNALIRFFDEGDQYQNGTTLIADPGYFYTIIANKKTVYTYEPKDLISIGSLPHSSIVSGSYDILIKSEVLEPLQQLCNDAKEINGKEAGGMKIVAGYLSYEDQVKLFEQAVEKYGKEDLLTYWDYPGHSEYQLGYTVQLLPEEVQADVTDKEKTDTMEDMSEDEKEQEIWLKDNAYKYGFIIRYLKGEEDATGKKHQPYTLRYVGKELAKVMHNKNLLMEDVDFSTYE